MLDRADLVDLFATDEAAFASRVTDVLAAEGLAYQNNPILYANRTLRRLTGYPLDDLVSANPRLLQGPGTEPGPLADLREALDIWEPVTVELTNYRTDGSWFRNRVSLLPMADETGTVSNWVGVQAAVDGRGAESGQRGGTAPR
jgi:PAS domain S-box-containing protein